MRAGGSRPVRPSTYELPGRFRLGRRLPQRASLAVELLQSLLAEGLAISIVTYAEVLEGICYGRRPAHYEVVFGRFLRGNRILGVTRPVAKRYAWISGDLRVRSLLIPPPDLFVAATAIQHRLLLVTRNRQYFERIRALQLL
ncbi:MAG: type II toxin-antitoxin system VapC family toxin [Chloroflexota bacterium]|nr:MAG: hypothetical protein DLM70_08700 [Chloroflexota bacterium]